MCQKQEAFKMSRIFQLDMRPEARPYSYIAIKEKETIQL